MIEIFEEIDQNSPEWFEVRRGLPTTSKFKDVLAKGEGKTRKSYLNRLAAEIITGQPGETFKRPELDRGHAMEGEARDFYAFFVNAEPKRIGFVRNGKKGSSPDSFIGDNGLLEIKTQRGDLLIETIDKGEFPAEHKAQVQGQLWVTEREYCDLIVYWPNMPPFIKRAYRDSFYISKLSQAIDQFNDELAATVERIKAYNPSIPAHERAA
jgi:hypothetical protein